MAIITRGSICPICEISLGSAAYVAFPPFVKNRLDPLYVLSDGVAHAACLSSIDLGRVAMSARQAATAQPRMCRACRRPIEPGEPAFCAGLLSSRPEEGVFKFNDACVHATHYSEWDEAGEFERVVSAWMASGEWSGPTIVFDPFPRWIADGDEKVETSDRRKVVRVGLRRRTPPESK